MTLNNEQGIKTPDGEMNETRAREFDVIATTVFAPIYPVIARQVLDRSGMDEGTALDIGCGPGLLSIALARQSRLRVFGLDRSPCMLAIAAGHIREAGLVQRVVPVLGDVHELPFEDRTIDLVVSRGSWFFWDDLVLAFREIHRIIAPGGTACIGGGFGNQVLKKEIETTMRARSPDWDNGVRERTMRNKPERIKADLERAGIRSYHLVQDETGFWAVIPGGRP